MTRFIKHILSLVLITLFCIPNLQSAIITVKQDGTGNCTTIQAGILACSYNSGDTVLVWPGVYYENIAYQGKYITVASLYIINPDKWYIYNTIIDGNQAGTTVNMYCGLNTITINGFSITNGKAVQGGGIYTDLSNVSIKNCIVENNTSRAGGGIFFNQTNAFISGTTIRYNHGRNLGGGICCGYNSVLQFDPVNKCNIYLNYSGLGTDIFKTYIAPPQTIILDTFTVINPDYHFVFSSTNDNLPSNDIDLQINHGYIEPVDHDLYVNPFTGNDNNSGISPSDPLKTIAFAYKLIKPDSISPNNIFLSNGLFSPSQNFEKLPLASRSFVSLIGNNMQSTIIDADSLSSFFEGYGLMKNFKIKNITFQHGKGSTLGGIYIENCDHISIENVILQNGGFASFTGFELYDIDSLLLKQVVIRNLIGKHVLVISNWEETIKSFYVENCIVTGNGPGDDPINTSLEGGGVGIIGDADMPISYFGEINNLQVTNNLRIPDPLWGSGMTVGIIVDQYCKVEMINSTIGHNTLQGSFGFGTTITSGAELNIYNSILYGDSLGELSLGYPNITNDPSTCRVYYSDIEGGQAEVMNWNNINTLVWGPGNIDADPLWDTIAAIPYALPWNSPCVNTGTPIYEFGMAPPYIIQEDTIYKLITFDYDTIVLPPTDLAGNPRIVGGRIDMGAYECQDTTTGSLEYKVISLKLKVEVYPNPFYANTFIMFELGGAAAIQVIIHDMNGNEVRALMDARVSKGKYNLVWDGKDDGGAVLPNGAYLVSVYINEKQAGSVKVVKKGR